MVRKNHPQSVIEYTFTLHATDGKEAKAVLDQVKCSSSPDLIRADIRASHALAGNQVRENLRKWLSPPDPSTNHNIACAAHHEGSATWFSQGSMFKDWKLTGSLLWIHGKRAHLAPLKSLRRLTAHYVL
jgi:hypothetical protein